MDTRLHLPVQAGRQHGRLRWATQFDLLTSVSTSTQIGVIAKTTGFWASIAGGIVGGVWMVRLGINGGLWIFGVAQAIAVLGLAWLAQVGANVIVLAAVIGFEAFGAVSAPRPSSPISPQPPTCATP